MIACVESLGRSSCWFEEIAGLARRRCLSCSRGRRLEERRRICWRVSGIRSIVSSSKIGYLWLSAHGGLACDSLFVWCRVCWWGRSWCQRTQVSIWSWKGWRLRHKVPILDMLHWRLVHVGHSLRTLGSATSSCFLVGWYTEEVLFHHVWIYSWRSQNTLKAHLVSLARSSLAPAGPHRRGWPSFWEESAWVASSGQVAHWLRHLELARSAFCLSPSLFHQRISSAGQARQLKRDVCSAGHPALCSLY